jgi:hypothetical protein
MLAAYWRWGRGAPFSSPEKLKEAFDRKPGVAKGMRFEHDCDSCVPIERIGKYDIYVCPQNGYPTVVAVYGDEPWEYESSSNLKLQEHNCLFDLVVEGEMLSVTARQIVV